MCKLDDDSGMHDSIDSLMLVTVIRVWTRRSHMEHLDSKLLPIFIPTSNQWVGGMPRFVQSVCMNLMCLTRLTRFRTPESWILFINVLVGVDLTDWIRSSSPHPSHHGQGCMAHGWSNFGCKLDDDSGMHDSIDS